MPEIGDELLRIRSVGCVGCVYAGRCVYASGRCVYASGRCVYASGCVYAAGAYASGQCGCAYSRVHNVASTSGAYKHQFGCAYTRVQCVYAAGAYKQVDRGLSSMYDE